jgi:hypothetical protein
LGIKTGWYSLYQESCLGVEESTLSGSHLLVVLLFLWIFLHNDVLLVLLLFLSCVGGKGGGGGGAGAAPGAVVQQQQGVRKTIDESESQFELPKLQHYTYRK